VIALLLATIYAPLFHVHTDAGESPFVHAHLPEFESSEDESVVHMEEPHSHAAARSIDILVTIAGQFIHFCVAIESASFGVVELQPSSGFAPAASPRAHAPPALQFLTPRAPPA